MKDYLTRLKSFISNHKKIIVLLLLILFLMLIFVLVIVFPSSKMFNFKKNSLSSVKNQPSSGIQTQLGKMGLVSKTSNSFPLATTAVFQVVADTDNQDISALDIIIHFDPEMLSFEGEQNQMSNFEYIRRLKKDLIYITAIKKPGNNDQTIFNNKAIFDLKFKTLKTGNSKIDLIYAPNLTRSSAFWDSKSRNLLSAVSGISIEIK